MAEYRRLTELSSTTPATQAPTDKRHYAPGTFGALVQDYLATAVYKEKKPSTRSEYRRVLEILQARHGDKPVHMIKKRHVRKMRDDRAETPGAANTLLRMLKIVSEFRGGRG